MSKVNEIRDHLKNWIISGLHHGRGHYILIVDDQNKRYSLSRCKRPSSQNRFSAYRPNLMDANHRSVGCQMFIREHSLTGRSRDKVVFLSDSVSRGEILSFLGGYENFSDAINLKKVVTSELMGLTADVYKMMDATFGLEFYFSRSSALRHRSLAASVGPAKQRMKLRNYWDERVGDFLRERLFDGKTFKFTTELHIQDMGVAEARQLTQSLNETVTVSNISLIQGFLRETGYAS